MQVCCRWRCVWCAPRLHSLLLHVLFGGSVLVVAVCRMAGLCSLAIVSLHWEWEVVCGVTCGVVSCGVVWCGVSVSCVHVCVSTHSSWCLSVSPCGVLFLCSVCVACPGYDAVIWVHSQAAGVYVFIVWWGLMLLPCSPACMPPPSTARPAAGAQLPLTRMFSWWWWWGVARALMWANTVWHTCRRRPCTRGAYCKAAYHNER
jgi:hypothetical protein